MTYLDGIFHGGNYDEVDEVVKVDFDSPISEKMSLSDKHVVFSIVCL